MVSSAFLCGWIGRGWFASVSNRAYFMCTRTKRAREWYGWRSSVARSPWTIIKCSFVEPIAYFGSSPEEIREDVEFMENFLREHPIDDDDQDPPPREARITAELTQRNPY